MKDSYERQIKYLRLSVTDLCNYRCIYCMPEDGIEKKQHGDMLSIEELTEIAKAAYALDIKKIRLTGGEPLVRKGIITLCENIRAIAPDIELTLTTNGALLPDMAESLKAAGVDRLNISIDSLDKDSYKKITRGGDLEKAIKGVKAAEKAGFDSIKINTVVIGGINVNAIYDFILMTKDFPFQVRFIELMPVGVTKDWDVNCFVSLTPLETYLQSHAEMQFDGVTRVYRMPEHKGTIGLISPLSNSFCPRCDKIRVTADGKLKPCLHSDTEIDLRGLHGDNLIKAIEQGILDKPFSHSLTAGGTETMRCMNEIGG